MKYLAATLLLVTVALCEGATLTLPESKPDVYSSDFWLIPGPSDRDTWIEIHNREDAKKTGIAHIFVLSRMKSDPVYAIERVYPHIAITTEALQRSVIRPYKTKWTYPEVFYEGYNRWEKSDQKDICTTSISDYLKSRTTSTEQDAAANP